MLPYFVASGHRLYAKSAYVYLQMMTALPETHPDVQKKFEEGFHVVRRSNRYWAGMSTDRIIEHVLMRSVKTHGGLTRGKGFTETQLLVWVLLMPACANINSAMQSFTGVSYANIKTCPRPGRLEMSVTLLPWSPISKTKSHSLRMLPCTTLLMVWQPSRESMLRNQGKLGVRIWSLW